MTVTKKSIIFTLAMAVALGSLSLLVVQQVDAWAWGGHNKMARDVAQAGGVSSNLVDTMRGQAAWADGRSWDSNKPEDGNGTYGIGEEKNVSFWDWAFDQVGAEFDHWFDVGINQGEAPNNSRRFLGWAAQWYINNGYTNFGFKVLGRGIHYIQDMSMPYHTVSYENNDDSDNDGTRDHFEYESWHNSNYSDQGMGTWVEWGTEYGTEYSISSDDGIYNQTERMAEDANSEFGNVNHGAWDDSPYYTKSLMWDYGERVEAIMEYIAPGHVSYG